MLDPWEQQRRRSYRQRASLSRPYFKTVISNEAIKNFAARLISTLLLVS